MYQVVEKHLDAFHDEVRARNKHIPNYVHQEFYSYLNCGRLENGFVRIRCDDCGHERLLAFSCKKRGFCPSCCGRRMNEAEKHLSDEVFPVQPARQWVLSLPVPIRMYCSRDRKIINALVKVFYSSIHSLIRKKLKKLDGVKNTHGGGSIFIQRLGGAMNLNLHFHSIFLDGGYSVDADGKYHFHNLADRLTSEDVAWAVKKIAMKSIKVLQKLGTLDDEMNSLCDTELNGIELCDGASIKNKIAFGPRAGKDVRRIRLNLTQTEPTIRGDLNADMHGFNLKADKVVKAHQRWKLNRLIRYVTRPPIATERLKLTENGSTVVYSMKKPWNDGTTEVLFSGVEFLEKLAAAVPPPRGHLVRYVGVFAPNSQHRDHVVLVKKPPARTIEGKRNLSHKQRTAWAELMKRSFGFELNECEVCGGKVRRLAVITNQKVIYQILEHLRRLGRYDSAVFFDNQPRPPPRLELLS